MKRVSICLNGTESRRHKDFKIVTRNLGLKSYCSLTHWRVRVGGREMGRGRERERRRRVESERKRRGG